MLASVLVLAKDFMGMPIEEPYGTDVKPLPTLIVGGGGFLDYFLNSVNGGVEASAEYRVHKHHSVGILGQYNFGSDFALVEGDYRFYFSGGLMQNGHDDFVRLGYGVLFMEKYDEFYYPQVVSLGYGRDILFFDTAKFMGRIQLGGSYIIGEPIAKENERLYIDEETHFLIYLSFSILFF